MTSSILSLRATRHENLVAAIPPLATIKMRSRKRGSNVIQIKLGPACGSLGITAVFWSAVSQSFRRKQLHGAKVSLLQRGYHCPAPSDVMSSLAWLFAREEVENILKMIGNEKSFCEGEVIELDSACSLLAVTVQYVLGSAARPWPQPFCLLLSGSLAFCLRSIIYYLLYISL